MREASSAFRELFGLDRESAGGRHVATLLATPEDQAAERAAWRGADWAMPMPREQRRRHRDGASRWVRVMRQPLASGSIRETVVDITEEKLRQADHEGQIDAIRKSQCVITFDMDGIILEANQLFLDRMGYAQDEVAGRHHRMFVDPSYSHGSEYALFWRDLAQGRHRSGEFRRIARNGRELWLQATYNPIFDGDGRVFKVVSHATDITEEKLRQADHQGQIAAIDKAECVISFALDGTILDANDNFLALTGYRLGEVRRRHHSIFVDRQEAEGRDYREFWRDLAAGRYRAGEYKRVGKDGREIWLQATYNPIFDINGRPFKVVKYATDITAEKQLRADYEGQIEAIRKSQYLISFDMSGTILDANDNFLVSMGYGREELRGRHHSLFVDAEYAGSAEYRDFWNTLQAGSFMSAKYKRFAKDGRAVWIQACYNPILDLNGRPFKVVKIATDITQDVERAEALNQARQQAQHDSATALPNRVRLASFMATALAERARLAVFYLDLDRFKPINDTYGHHAGDHVLGVIADRLRACLAEDQLVARIGGDEFVIAAPDLSDEAIEILCRRLIAAVSATIFHEAGELSVGLSLGVAISPDDAATPEELLRCADEALYRSKSGGRGIYSFFDTERDARLSQQRQLTEDMRRAIDAGEFFLEYQPRFAPKTRAVQSVEALVRWQHPERGRLAPMDFIPLAEKSGVIVPLGRWILERACADALAWPGIGISVNVSPAQFRSGTLLETVDAVLAERGLDPARLELEVTEGLLLQDEERALLALQALKTRGIRLAMDDFGTGYSSLGYLRSFPFDVIKIDRCFIADLETRDGGRPIVQAILGLGKALGLSVTAEGVETDDQLLLLTTDECPEVQGFLLARPMSAAAISDLLAETQPQRFAAE